MSDLFELRGKVAVVVGGAGELCGAMGEGLATAGAEVFLADREPEKARSRLERIAAAGGKASSLMCDATSKDDLEALLAETRRRCGQVDILINGAGINSACPFLEIPEAEYDQIMTVNVKTVFLACQVFGRYFVERARRDGVGASIINMGSMAGLTPLSRVFTYSISKAAVHNLSKNLAREWAALGIRVNVMVPGFFPAEQNRKVLTPERVASIMAHTPMGRFGEAENLVGATLLLASDRAGAFITGTELVVDGGFNAMSI
ncbi:MAG TPA: SDR family oxidoreductase [Thermoanaerobaculaceae bacterium]|nr:SDR family oxidoreductase [Thermoanaerobaculaceae bacterium]HPS76632.1 SDR family oxidoreductase [Thermoanaerobaculaceae bacterium]